MAENLGQTDAAAALRTICRYCMQLHPHVRDLQRAADGGTSKRKSTAMAGAMPPTGYTAVALSKRTPLAQLLRIANAVKASDGTDQVLLLCFALLWQRV